MMMAQAFFNRIIAEGLALERVPYAINIGCGDGVEMNDPVYPLYQSGFTGVAIDADASPRLAENLGGFGVVLKPGTPIDIDNILPILKEARCPTNPSFLKMDIDGFDAEILQAILSGGIRPLVIQAEINTEIPPPYAFSTCFSKNYKPGGHHGFYGFSLSYGIDILGKFGYRLTNLDFETQWTHDGLWVHESLLERSNIPSINPTDAFMSRPPFLPHIAVATTETMISWRTRTDRQTVRNEIWSTMLECCKLKHGHADVPFELYISR